MPSATTVHAARSRLDTTTAAPAAPRDACEGVFARCDDVPAARHRLQLHPYEFVLQQPLAQAIELEGLEIFAGRITAIEGVEKLQREFGEHVVWNTLSPIGARRRDWRKTLVSDGFVMLRHPDLAATLEMADKVGSELHLFAE